LAGPVAHTGELDGTSDGIHHCGSQKKPAILRKIVRFVEALLGTSSKSPQRSPTSIVDLNLPGVSDDSDAAT
jgi:hypothetical protein